jgi:hypothetical protein
MTTKKEQQKKTKEDIKMLKRRYAEWMEKKTEELCVDYEKCFRDAQEDFGLEEQWND